MIAVCFQFSGKGWAVVFTRVARVAGAVPNSPIGTGVLAAYAHLNGSERHISQRGAAERRACDERLYRTAIIRFRLRRAVG